jgi:uncharacterized protein
MYMIGIAIGLVAGVLGGVVGIGGGIIMIPALSLILGYNQHAAQGTTLAAMVPPIGILAAYVYYQKGFVNIPLAACIALGFLAGGMLGANIAVSIDETTMRRIFGGLMLIMSVYFIFGK